MRSWRWCGKSERSATKTTKDASHEEHEEFGHEEHEDSAAKDASHEEHEEFGHEEHEDSAAKNASHEGHEGHDGFATKDTKATMVSPRRARSQRNVYATKSTMIQRLLFVTLSGSSLFFEHTFMPRVG
jgi:hypothetical protein